MEASSVSCMRHETRSRQISIELSVLPHFIRECWVEMENSRLGNFKNLLCQSQILRKSSGISSSPCFVLCCVLAGATFLCGTHLHLFCYLAALLEASL